MTYPAQVIDLRNWKITLPIGSSGSPTEVKQTALATYSHADYFCALPGGGVRFRAPVNGVTTSGSANPRSELREMNGSAGASWSSTDGKTHTLVVDEAVTRIPNKRSSGDAATVCAQIHDANDDISVFRVESGKVYVTKGNDTHYAIADSAYVPGTRFRAMFVVADGTVTAYYNGRKVCSFAAEFSGAYFKAGAYTQANCSNSSPCSADNYGETVIYDLAVAHGTAAPPVEQPPASQTLGVGGVATPAGAKLATADSTDPVTFSVPGVYDGQGHTIGAVTLKSGVTAQNYRIVAGSQYGAVLLGDDIVFQNNDISGVSRSGDGDLNAITYFGNNIKIRYNTAVDFVAGDPGDSHTDFAQTWVSAAHPNASSNTEIVGNKATGPANPSRDPKVPSIHQFLMIEGAGRGGNSGGSGKPSHILVADNIIGDSWNQAIKLDGVDDVTITRNQFVGSSDHVIEVTEASTNVKFLADNVISGQYGSVGTQPTPPSQEPPPVVTPPVSEMPASGWPRDPHQPKRVVIVLRHGEKDDNNDGKDDVLHELSKTGEKRAQALKEAWLKAALPAGLYHPDRAVASKGNTASDRPLMTIKPLVDASNGKLPLNTKYDAEKDYKTLGPWLAQRLDVTLVCLEHTAIVPTCKLLGKITPALPKAWDSKRFDLYWVFTSDDGKNWKFTQIPQKLLPGDKDTVIK